MKRPIVVANWKMQLGLKEGELLMDDILNRLEKIKKIAEKVDIIFCPPFFALESVSKKLKGSFSLLNRKNQMTNLFLGAQDCFWEHKGAFTGEISPDQLKELGCQYVIIGHSERRQNLGETDEMVHHKIKTVLESELVPILCVGETFEERQNGAKDYVIINQVTRALEGNVLKADQEIIIAYEPIWVIGSGQVVTQEEAQYTNQVIQQRMIDFYPLPLIKNNIRLLYGGGIDSTNVGQFIEKDIIDGILVGNASLKAEEFVKIIETIGLKSTQ
ncbi:MAG: triose-phosphate isomerase [Patescibacteria group bacterium]|nr:triose-phosphate isomerase [Patescibacteria group bacterium]